MEEGVDRDFWAKEIGEGFFDGTDALEIDCRYRKGAGSDARGAGRCRGLGGEEEEECLTYSIDTRKPELNELSFPILDDPKSHLQ